MKIRIPVIAAGIKRAIRSEANGNILQRRASIDLFVGLILFPSVIDRWIGFSAEPIRTVPPRRPKPALMVF